MNVLKELESDAIDMFASVIFEDRFWNDVKMFVSEASNTNKSNEAKKHQVRKNLLIVFEDIGEFILNLAIELAVTLLKAKVDDAGR
jgi:hypothetical protein